MNADSLLVVGSVNVDLILRVAEHPYPGETVLADAASHSPGGKGANQAVAAARLGCDVTFLGAVGDDANAKAGVQLLERAGVNLDLLQHVPGPTGLAVITLDTHGENSIVVLPGANSALKLDELSTRAIATAPIVLIQGEVAPTVIAAVAASTKGRFILNLAPFLEVPLAVLTCADPLVVNEHEARLVAAQFTQTDADPPTPEETARLLLSKGIPSVVITLGACGALVADRTLLTLVPAPPSQAVDTTGAGDAFCGALAAALAGGDSLEAAARWANRAASFSVQRLGAQPSYPRSEDLGG